MLKALSRVGRPVFHPPNFVFIYIYMKNDDFVVPICILMIAAACHIICNNQRGRRTWVRPWIQLRREVGAYHAFGGKY
jgi:hypothetical protein